MKFAFSNYQFYRRCSGFFLVAGDVILFLSNLYQTNFYQLLAGLLFTTGSLALIPSAQNHRWLYYCSASIILGYVFICISSSGEGEIFILIGSFIGLIAGLLNLRAAIQRGGCNRLTFQSKFQILRFVDRFPLASSGAVEGVFCIFVTIGAYLNGDARLALIALLWIIGHILQILSDEYLLTVLSREPNHKPSN